MKDADNLDDLVRDVVVKRFESSVRNYLNRLIEDAARNKSYPIDPDESIVMYSRFDKDFLRFYLLKMDKELGITSANVFKERISDYLQLDKMSVNAVVKYYVRDFLKNYEN